MTKSFKSSMTLGAGSASSLFTMDPDDHPGPIKVVVSGSRSPWAKIANVVLSTKKEVKDSIQQFNQYFDLRVKAE